MSAANMQTEDMRKIIESAKVGDTILVKQAGGRATRYTVRGISGRKARQLALDGSRGAMRVLVDDGEVWIRDAKARAADEKAYRRVMVVQLVKPQAPAPELLRDMAVREAGLPPGYDIELDPSGFKTTLDGAPIGVHASAFVAVCKAWSNWASRITEVSDGRGKRMLARLPNGYTIESGEPSFFRAVFDESGWIGVTRDSTGEAVIDAWTHCRAMLLGELRMIKREDGRT
jgi:hypothetical protein